MLLSYSANKDREDVSMWTCKAGRDMSPTLAAGNYSKNGFYKVQVPGLVNTNSPHNGF